MKIKSTDDDDDGVDDDDADINDHYTNNDLNDS